MKASLILRPPTARNVPEWQGATPNAHIPLRVQVRLLLASGGRCASCTRRVGIGAEPHAFDHVTALVNGGSHAESNLQVLCTTCHAIKTRADVAEKSTVARKRQKHLGVKTRGRGFTSWRGMDGSIRRREDRA